MLRRKELRGRPVSPSRHQLQHGGTVEFYSRRKDSVIDRRTFIGAVAAGIIAVPLVARAQTATTVRRIGFLAGGAQPTPADLQGMSPSFCGDGFGLTTETRGEGARPTLVGALFVPRGRYASPLSGSRTPSLEFSPLLIRGPRRRRHWRFRCVRQRSHPQIAATLR